MALDLKLIVMMGIETMGMVVMKIVKYKKIGTVKEVLLQKPAIAYLFYLIDHLFQQPVLFTCLVKLSRVLDCLIFPHNSLKTNVLFVVNSYGYV